jgi:hypothetical protein
MAEKSFEFNAIIEIIGINPFVFVPEPILIEIFKHFGKDKGPVPIKGEINGIAYKQTLVKYKGSWRLYINTAMLVNSPRRIGEEIHLTVGLDTEDRTIEPHPEFIKALNQNPGAKSVFENLSKSRKNEIVRTISYLKTEESINRNIKKAIDFLQYKGRFAGRDKP